MSETREAKRLRLAKEADAMKQKNTTAQNLPKDVHEATRLGYNAAVSNSATSRDKAPFSSPELRKAWKAGY